MLLSTLELPILKYVKIELKMEGITYVLLEVEHLCNGWVKKYRVNPI